MNTHDFFEEFRIFELRIGADLDIRDRAVSRIEVVFADDPGEGARGYRVDFKLLDRAADAHRFLRRIGPPPDCRPEWTPEGARLGAELQQALLRDLLHAIADRVAKVHKEQSIQHIRPVGKAFVLMGRTRFEVLADDGAGRLRIRIHHPGGPREAGLSANDLLDGLYSGLIKRV